MLRTLLIDNYDSFTFNLAHYLTEVGGRAPTVLRNDDPSWTPDRLQEFDNIVISPGPGNPEHGTDFGICAEVIRDARIPLLGVCLGHQGICHVFGGSIHHAPEAYHGRLSAIEHEGDPLFAGIPTGFAAVRYHSLMATDLPPELRALAWTADGVLMAVRHRSRPLWGVQFHPESVCTEYGHRLIENFTELTVRWQRDHAIPVPSPTSAVPEPTAPHPRAPRPHSPTHRVLARAVACAADPEEVFAAWYAGSPQAFWLDSSLPGGPDGRFSVMGDAGGPLARVVTADVWRGRVTVEEHGVRRVTEGAFLDWLDADLARFDVEADDPALPFAFRPGWVGYLGYELKAECGGDRRHRATTAPDAAMVFADRALVFDHQDRVVHVLALAPAAEEQRTADWVAATADRLLSFGAPTPQPTPPPPTGARLELRHDRRAYLDRIAACQRAIADGESYEICLTNMVSAPLALDPWPAYRTLRSQNPAPFAAYLALGDVTVLSSSPERFLRVSADRIAQTRPIKGTRPRGPDEATDRRLRTELAQSVKDRAENLMIVDLARNDLARSSVPGSVRVDAMFSVESYRTVHQLVSTVSSRLRPGVSAVACMRAAFPGGSMTGAPKIRAMQLIDELEGGPRGVYSGALGYFGVTGATDLSMVIRTLVATGDRIEYGIGGAITALSDPDDEFEETVVKAGGLLRLLEVDFPVAAQEPAPPPAAVQLLDGIAGP